MRMRRNHGQRCGRILHGQAAPMTLDQATAGDRLVVRSVGDESARMHAIRFGMAEGAEVTCITRIPGGPVVLKCGRQEIAVGRKLAECIHVHSATLNAPGPGTPDRTPATDGGVA